MQRTQLSARLKRKIECHKKIKVFLRKLTVRMNGTDNYMKTLHKRSGNTDDEMESTDDLETVDRWNNEYDNFSVQNNDDVIMNESWDNDSYNPLD